jgi:hypothetical protein
MLGDPQHTAPSDLMRKSQPIDALIDARPNQMHGDSAIGHVKHVRVFRTGSVEIFNGTVRPRAPGLPHSRRASPARHL